ncbi:hypothetical protein [Methylobrevis pamukkalensis]|uniref:Integral membrane protein n=1 Tax=Methylobrevis pamukkalensis TaxID=1439726 RepID=A0A1E3H2I5_9HYPH|nr:hypothetical protein [Methylobrevis pamukkalensis]ODN70533.1 hypothetical protein A6302_02135 [Methylobrevis pamukkalensis]
MIARRLPHLSLLLLTVPVFAGAFPVPARADCTCRFSGTEWQLGAKVCLPRGDRMVIAECRMNQNVTSWVPVSGDCAVSADAGTAARAHAVAHAHGPGPAPRTTVALR